MSTSARIQRSVAIALCVLGCEEGAVRRDAAPGEEVLPSAGKPSQSDDSGKTSSGSASSEGGAGDDGSAGGDVTQGGSDFGGGIAVGTELRVAVTAAAPTFVSLARAEVVEVDDASTSTDWDLQFQGWDIFTNGGASGGGKGAAFGPLPFTYFLAAEEPTEVPFLIEDKAAGAFLDWYLYDGQWHSLYSRFHVYGVKSGDRLFKLQVLGYYGDVQGAPIAALYRLRYAEVTADAQGEVVEVQKVDATAGGLGGDDGATSGCLTLLSGEQTQLTPAQAAESSSWDLRFWRDSISVNGGLGGPGDVTAVDLDAASTESEQLEEIELRTAENQAARFAAVGYDTLSEPALKYRGDRVVSAFSEAWIDPGNDTPALATDNAWLVAAADGKARYLLGITAIEQPTAEAAGKVVMRILKVR